MENQFSWWNVFRELSEKSKNLLSTDITRRSRLERRKRECAKRGIKIPPNDERQRMIQGVLGTGTSTNFAVDGEDIEIDESTWVFGELQTGAQVSVVVGEQADGKRKARKIIVEGR